MTRGTTARTVAFKRVHVRMQDTIAIYKRVSNGTRPIPEIKYKHDDPECVQYFVF